MATSFKTITEDKRTITRTMLHEVIPITGSLIAGTYATSSTTGRELNVKNFSHGMYQSVYDYPYASSSANHIFDISYGFSTLGSTLSGSATNQVAKKVNIYNQMSQVLVGYDTGSNIRRFDQDGNLSAGSKHDNVVFFNFSRLLTKDEIKKGSFSMDLATNSTYATPSGEHDITISDSGALNSYHINSPAGEYGILNFTDVAANAVITVGGNPDTNQTFTLTDTAGASVEFTFSRTNNTVNATSIGIQAVLSNNANIAARIQQAIAATSLAVTAVQDGATVTITQNTAGSAGNRALDVTSVDGLSVPDNIFKNGRDGSNAGLIYYQAGVAVLTSSVFTNSAQMNAAGNTIEQLALTGTIDAVADGIRKRIKNINFHNTTELNSSIFFCTAGPNEFNYSSNPTYLDGSKIRVKAGTGTREENNPPFSYITTVGLYSADNELLAVAKLSEPIKKMPGNEVTLRVRLDY